MLNLEKSKYTVKQVKIPCFHPYPYPYITTVNFFFLDI